ncbi:MAG TPA: extracellular solute-binding protein [Chloroflexota bacterium]|nr:extracellular solute-binding protein [Chloroflexota bacterium]
MIEQPTRTISRRQALRGAAIGLGVLALAGCGQGAAPAPSASSASASASSAWDQLVAAAKSEGQVVVTGPPDPGSRQQLPAQFKNRFGIELQYLGGNSGDAVSRMQAERAAGQYTVDAMVSGGDPAHPVLLADGWLDSLKAALVLPEDVDGQNWKTGAPWFRDPDGQYLLQLFNTVQSGVTLNTTIVGVKDVPTADSLLDPRWKGKISSFDPTVPGIGLAIWSAFYVSKGADFCTQLFKGQQITITRDYSQSADWLAHGSYPIGLAVSQNYLDPFKQAGVTFANLDLPDAPNAVGGGFGVVSLLNHAPHPNAARVFVNWLASKEGTTLYGKLQSQAPVRSDVDASWMDPALLPKPVVKYIDTYDHDFIVNQRVKIQDFFSKLLK